jgi:hypothetical protein
MTHRRLETRSSDVSVSPVIAIRTTPPDLSPSWPIAQTRLETQVSVATRPWLTLRGSSLAHHS